MKSVLLWALIIGATALVANAQNANVTWQTPQTIAGASDVNISGWLYGTWAPGDDYWGDQTVNAANYTVNGVDFLTYGTPGVNFALTGDSVDRYNGFASPGTSDTVYNNLLTVGSFSWTGNPWVLSWNGMTPGHTYLFQAWENDARNTGSDASETFTGGANASNPVFRGDGAPGQYIIGTFVADNTGSEDISISPAIEINLVQVRDLTAPPVPEPSTFILLASGMGAMFLLLHRRNTAGLA